MIRIPPATERRSGDPSLEIAFPVRVIYPDAFAAYELQRLLIKQRRVPP